jgi:hypothetical protein
VRIARDLVSQDRALEAYPYLLAAEKYAKAKEMMNKNIYNSLGTWAISSGERVGERFAFYLNGTCTIAGKEYLFNMPGAYPIMIGEKEDDMIRMFSYSSGSKDTLRLRDEATGKTLSLTRVKQAEFSPTEDGEGVITIQVLSDDDETDNPPADLELEDINDLEDGEDDGEDSDE